MFGWMRRPVSVRVSGGVRSSSDVTINEHRAATDESVRLLSEFEASARNKIIAQARTQSCAIDAVVTLSNDHMRGERVLSAKATVNGEDLIATVYIRDGESEIDAFRSLSLKLAETISRIILERSFMEIYRGMGKRVR